MTLEEEIKRLEKDAEELEEEAIKGCCDDTEIMDNCIECAKEHRQLAEWLRELKDYRERMPSYEAGYNDAKREIVLSGEYERAYQRGYMKAMEYCTNKLKDVNKQTEVNADD